MAVTIKAYNNFLVDMNSNPNIPQKGKNYDADPNQIVIWANSYAPTCVNALTVAGANLRRVSFTDFLKGVEACINQLPAKTLQNSVILVAEDKSNKWVAEIAMKYFPKNFSSNTKCLELGQQEAGVFVNTLDKIPQKIWPANIVLFDDAGFSGKQMTGHLKKIAQKIGPQQTKTNVYAVLPFVTNVAVNELEKARQLFQENSKGNMQLRVVYSEIIPTVKEILPPADFDELNNYLGEILEPKQGDNKGKDSGIAVTYFDHKIPNNQSFLFTAIARDTMPKITPPYLQ